MFGGLESALQNMLLDTDEKEVPRPVVKAMTAQDLFPEIVNTKQAPLMDTYSLEEYQSLFEMRKKREAIEVALKRGNDYKAKRPPALDLNNTTNNSKATEKSKELNKSSSTYDVKDDENNEGTGT